MVTIASYLWKNADPYRIRRQDGESETCTQTTNCAEKQEARVKTQEADLRRASMTDALGMTPTQEESDGNERPAASS